CDQGATLIFLVRDPDLSCVPGGNVALHTERVVGRAKEISSVDEIQAQLRIRVDNNHCSAFAGPPELHGTSADPDCGLLHYGTKNADLVSMPFAVGHPNGFATFSFSLVKGVHGLTLPAA